MIIFGSYVIIHESYMIICGADMIMYGTYMIIYGPCDHIRSIHDRIWIIYDHISSIWDLIWSYDWRNPGRALGGEIRWIAGFLDASSVCPRLTWFLASGQKSDESLVGVLLRQHTCNGKVVGSLKYTAASHTHGATAFLYSLNHGRSGESPHLFTAGEHIHRSFRWMFPVRWILPVIGFNSSSPDRF